MALDWHHDISLLGLHRQEPWRLARASPAYLRGMLRIREIPIWYARANLSSQPTTPEIQARMLDLNDVSHSDCSEAGIEEFSAKNATELQA